MASAGTPQNSGTSTADRPTFLTAPEVADILRLEGPWQVAALCRSGALKATKPGKQWLIRNTDLDTYIASGYNDVEASA